MYRGGIILKTEEQLDAMAAAGRIHARCLKMLASKCRPGVTTSELDEAAEKFIRSQGASPTFKGYRGFPGSICASPNAMVVHGIPDAYALQRGDILSLDVGVTKDGWVADGAITVAVGRGLGDRPAPARHHRGRAPRGGGAGAARQPALGHLPRGADHRRGRTASR